jgi:hypothetical protein
MTKLLLVLILGVLIMVNYDVLKSRALEWSKSVHVQIDTK